MSSLVQILIIDDQTGDAHSPHQRSFLRAYADPAFEFQFESCAANGRYDPLKAVQALHERPDTNLVLLDIKFGGEGDRLGYKILSLLTGQFPAVPVLILSSVNRDIASLGRCLEDGAVGFINKGLQRKTFRETIHQALSIGRSHVLLGQSAPLRQLRRQAARLSPYDQIPVLIIGERGTGKERVARYIHHSGPRGNGPFVAVNSAAIPEALVEAELFGAEKGAYTGATNTRVGYFERARGGVLFLDEIGNMGQGAQAKLLRVLQDGRFRKVGVSEEEFTADIQLVCATNIEPDTLIRESKLREDFYDRIAAVTVRTPPLRECRNDIPELASHFLRQLGLAGKKRLSSAVTEILGAFDWPGNVRQLQRAIQEAVVRSEDEAEIVPAHLPAFLHPTTSHRVPLGIVPSIGSVLPEDPSTWPATRLLAEVELALAARRRIQAYKGRQWKAEFMRLMYPHCKAANAKGFDDLVKRLTQGPWGELNWRQIPSVRNLIEELTS